MKSTFLVAGLWLASQSAFAINWDYVPSLATGASYESNPRYVRATEAESASGIYLDGNLDLSAETPRHRLGLTPRIRSSFYPTSSNSDLNDTDLYLTATDDFRGLRNLLSTTLDWSRIATRTTFPNPLALQNPSAPDIVNVNEYRSLLSASPSWKYLWSERTSIQLQAGYSDFSYSQSGQTNRNSYRYVNSSLAIDRVLSSKTHVSLSLSSSLFTTGQPTYAISNNTLDYGLNATYDYQWTDSLGLGGSIGSRHSMIRVGSSVDLSTGLRCVDPAMLPVITQVRCHTEANNRTLVGQVFLRKRIKDKTTSNLSIGRTIEPTSEGTTVTQDNLSAFINRDITATIGAFAGVTAYRQHSVARITSRTANYIGTELGMDWHFLERWTLHGSYTFADSQTKGQASIAGTNLLIFDSTTRSHAVRLEIRWQGLGHHESTGR